MSKLYNNVLEIIGNTPCVKINELVDDEANLYAKLEYFNPGFSIKDRAAYNMIVQAMKDGKINKDTVIIEPTSGNTGIGLALVCSIFKMTLILTMPESMSLERQKMLKHLGAKLILTKKELGMQGAVDEAIKINNETKNSLIMSQFDNPNNPLAHEKTTAIELFNDFDGKIDYFVASFGTGGTVSGVGKKLKELIPNIKIIAVEPAESPLLSQGKASSHGIQGIGANFIPDNLDKSLIDEIITVKTVDAIETAKEAAQKEGILCGISSGANIFAAKQIANKNKGKTVVTVCTDLAERYISTALFE